MIYPVFVAPLFNDYHPLPEGELRQSIVTLAKESGDPFRRYLLVRRFAPDQAHQRQCLRPLRYDAHRAERQPAERNDAARNPRGHGARNGPLRVESLAVAAARLRADDGIRFLGRSTGCSAISSAVMANAGACATCPIRRDCRSRSRSSRSSCTCCRRFRIRSSGRPRTRPMLSGSRRRTNPTVSPVSPCDLSVYRKLEPSRLEEIVFFDHPSGRARVERAMRWFADHPPGGA